MPQNGFLFRVHRGKHNAVHRTPTGTIREASGNECTTHTPSMASPRPALVPHKPPNARGISTTTRPKRTRAQGLCHALYGRWCSLQTAAPEPT
mmetsp:Transcript_3739/g.6007  ORF Transcript_3739/g.6007 Transcript_3739/m.6007 type:complete len:93 (-) Transcript_3739:1670-1948(-)